MTNLYLQSDLFLVTTNAANLQIDPNSENKIDNCWYIVICIKSRVDDSFICW